MPVILKWFYMVLLFHRWYIVLHLIGCGRSSMKILFVVVLSSYGNVIWCIVGLLVSRFALHFLSWVVVLKWWYLFRYWYMVYSTRFTRSLYSVIPTRLIYGLWLCVALDR